MKKILLAVVFTAVLSSVEVIAQVFIPRPPVVNIPVLNAAGMHIQNQVFRNMITGRTRAGGTNGAKTRSAATAVDYTMFKPREENYLPKLLAQSGKGSAAEQREAEQFYNSLIEMYEQGAPHHQLPKNDVAYALAYFILINYEVYNDLMPVAIDKDPWAKRARNDSERTALMNTKNSRITSTEEDRAMYYQFKEMLSAKPEIKKMIDADKQKLTETLAIMCGAVQTGYLKAIDEEDEKSIREMHEAAKQSLEQLLGVPINKIKFSLSGLQLR